MPTIWDKIYQDYQQGGKAWATIEGEVIPHFVEFLNDNTFDKKSALEIGCGTGKYLLFLQKAGFKVTGIDNSPTAIKMSKQNLVINAELIEVDMFKYEIEKNKYDLIFSIFSLNHGFKDQIKKAIDKIYSALLPGGKIFITLPEIKNVDTWNTFRDGNAEDLGNGTFAPKTGPEKGLPHSFFTEQEIKDMFGKFKNLKMQVREGKFVHGDWVIEGKK